MATEGQRTRRTCVFCGVGGKLDQEHIIPAWVSRMLPDTGKGTHVRIRGGGVGQERSTWRDAAHTTTAGVVCPTCNRGWMSDQETPVKPLLTPIIMGEARQFQPKDLRRLGIWAFTRALIGAARMPLIPKAPYSFLHAKRRPPNRTKIWFGTWALGLEGHYAAIVPLGLREKPPGGQPANGYMATFSVGHALFHVFGNESGRASAHGFRGELGRAFTQIWPPHRSASWPTERFLDEATLDAIAERYGPVFT